MDKLLDKWGDKILLEYLNIKTNVLSRNFKDENEGNDMINELNHLNEMFHSFCGHNIESVLTLEKVNSLELLNKIKKENSKENKTETDKVNNPKPDGENKGTKFEYEGRDKEDHELYELKTGAMETLEYDREPSDKFKKRAENAILGSSETGNGGTSGDYEQDQEFGKKFIDDAKKFKAKVDGEKIPMMSMGDDIEEIKNKKVYNKPLAMENENKTTKTMKRLKYKNEIGGVDNLSKLVIPESVKIDGEKFIITDGNETYNVMWEGTVNEGEIMVIDYKKDSIIKESVSKINVLSNYSTKEELTKRHKSTISENEMFEKMLLISKKLVDNKDEE